MTASDPEPLIAHNPADGANRPDVERDASPTTALSRDQADRFIAVAEKDGPRSSSRKMHILRVLADAPAGLTVLHIMERVPRGVERRKSLVAYQGALRELAAVGLAEVAGTTPGIGGAPRNLWRITGFGLHRARKGLPPAEARKPLLEQSAVATGRRHGHVFTQAQRTSFAAANQRRTAEAAVSSGARICQALGQLAALGVTLPPSHQEAARLRIEHPAASLAELARMAAAPCTKDALAGRLRRVIAAADAQAAQLDFPVADPSTVPGRTAATRQARRPPRAARIAPVSAKAPGP